MTTIALRNLSKKYREPGGLVRHLFDNLDLDIRDDDRSIAILGRSGSGKSTLLDIVGGLDTRYGGSYSVDGRELPRTEASLSAFRRKHVGIVTQRFDLIGDRTALQNVMLGLGSTRPAHRAPAMEALTDVGIGELARQRVRRLSGGEAQRVAIARALVKKPRIVLADEPTGALDEATEEEILRLFARLQDRGSTLIVATHSDRVAGHCDRRFVIDDQRLIER